MGKENSGFSRVCSQCNLPIVDSQNMRVADWAETCNCQKVELSGQTIDICQICKSPKAIGMDGSITQWIFRFALCDCSKESESHLSIEEISSSFEERVSSDLTQSSLSIAVDGNTFPASRYKPIKELGTGGRGQVYHCYDKVLNKDVALKCLNFMSDELQKHFQNEAKIHTQLEHTNIAKIFDYGLSEFGAPYMVLEFLDGRNLDEYRRENDKFNENDALEIFVDICRALQYSHSKDVLHGDIKPANVIVDETSGTERRIKLIDFGLAVQRKKKSQDEISEGLVGTPLYMPPERIDGLPYDERSEIYSLGCLFFELLTGEPPFNGDSVLHILSMQSSSPTPDLESKNLDQKVCAIFNPIVFKCTNKDPEERYQSIEELLDVLMLVDFDVLEEEALDSAVDSARPELTSYHHREWIIAGFAVLFLLLATGGLLYYQSRYSFFSEKAVETKEMKIQVSSVKQDNNGFVKPVDIDGFSDHDFTKLKGHKYHYLSFEGSSVTGVGLKNLVGEKIYGLSFSWTRFKNDSCSFLNMFPELNSLSLSGTVVDIEGLKQLEYPQNIADLDLSHCKKIDNRAVKYIFDNFTRLVSLNLSRTKIEASHISGIKKLNSLRKLDLSGLNLSEEDYLSIGSLKLAELSLNHCNLNGQQLLALANNPNLRSISIIGCDKISDEDLEQLKLSNPSLAIISSLPSIK